MVPGSSLSLAATASRGAAWSTAKCPGPPAEAVLWVPAQISLADSVCLSIKWNDNLDRLLVQEAYTSAPREADAWGQGSLAEDAQDHCCLQLLDLWTLPLPISRAPVSLLHSIRCGFWTQGWPCPFIPRM